MLAETSIDYSHLWYINEVILWLKIEFDFFLETVLLFWYNFKIRILHSVAYLKIGGHFLIMYIKCWGSRGQIPVSGVEYNKYGGDTTCIEIEASSGETVIIDAGSGIRHLGQKLLIGQKKSVHLIFTHLHLDHILGFPFFGPIYKRGFSITVYGCPFKGIDFKDSLNGMMRAPYFPVDLKNVPAKLKFKNISNRSLRIGSLRIHPILLNHPNGGMGYRIEDDRKNFVFLTDNELGYDLPGNQPFDYYVEFAKGADLLIHDAEFDKEEYLKYKAWGHSMYADAVKLGAESGVKRLGLFHINNMRTDSQVDFMVKDARRLVEKTGKKIDCFAVGSGFELTL
jgi:phosphoribosyl 1,2-cyclic phosphodiesterase